MPSESRDERLESLRGWIQPLVDGGFDSFDQVVETATQMAEDDFPGEDVEDLARRLVTEEFERHSRVQAGWPTSTDCDRLDAAFKQLNESGVVARQHFSCCGTCAAGEIRDVMAELMSNGETVRGYTSYDIQSTEAATRGYGIALNYGAVEDGEAAALRIGNEIVDVLEYHGLKVNWTGSWDRRIMVDLDWKRRRSSVDFAESRK